MMYRTSTLPALVSSTLIITSDVSFKSKTAYVAHSSIEGRLTFISKEDDVKEIVIDFTSDENVAASIIQYLHVRKTLGMPVQNRAFVLKGECENLIAVKNDLESLGHIVTTQ